ncbi:protein VAC14 homolog [Lepeophtheirus salmonis]|uniref:protein VAC14 homolog n=1 Tax=Lepeophtheirus salmonis TaxID=72036 RepID=UPI003AF355EF
MGDHSPLSAQCVKALTDKMNEKKRAAAVEIEKMAREFVENGNKTVPLNRLIKVLAEDFVKTNLPHYRKGGLIGLAAVAVGLGPDNIGNYMEVLINPNLTCLSDNDPKVKATACESLYNIIKMGQKATLPYFVKIFLAIIPAVTDTDPYVHNGGELLDRTLKDIVLNCSDFNLEEFIPILKERFYVKDSFARMFLLSWLKLIEEKSLPTATSHIAEFIDALFNILSDSKSDIYTLCENILNQFLERIKANPQLINYSEIYDFLMVHSCSNNERLQIVAVHWIHEFVNLSGGRDTLPRIGVILKTVLKNLSVDQDALESRRFLSYSKFRDMCDKVNLDLMHLTHELGENKAGGLSSQELILILKELIELMKTGNVETRLACLRWVYHLFEVFPQNLHFPHLIILINDQSDDVVILTLEVFSKICCISKANGGARFKVFVSNLLKLFREDKKLLELRGSFIIRQLCLKLNSEDVYRCVSELLVSEKNLHFARLMVENLSTILLTTQELCELRNALKDLNSKEACEIFCCLYRTWCHSPVATLALCLLSGCYKHVGSLIQIISTTDITIEILVELDKLVQLIESPIFTHMRMQLLDTENNSDLIHAFYGLLMLLPQSNAFNILKTRLSCIPPVSNHQGSVRQFIQSKPSTRKYLDEIDFESLSTHYIDLQEQHKKQYKESKKRELLNQVVVKNTRTSISPDSSRL